MPSVETTIERMQDDYDWAQVFGDDEFANYNGNAVESFDGTHTGQCLRSDVQQIIAAVEGENDGDEWVGVFLMRDGRYLAACGWCDYTGWD